VFKNRFRVGKILGIPIHIDATWVLIFVWVTWSLSASYFPERYPYWSPTLTWSLGVASSLLFFASVLLHELGHALVARAQGVHVQDITLFIFGGMAEITEEPKKPAKEFTMALAGPLVSLALSGLFAALHLLTRHVNEPFAALSLFLGSVNLSLGIFNLIPGFPLDGGRVLRAILWQARHDLTRATRWASRVGQAVAYVFILLGIVHAFAGNWVNGLWLTLIGLFLDNAARSSYYQLTLRQLLRGHLVRDIMRRECALLPPQLTLDVLVDQYILRGTQRCFAVGHQGKVEGLLTIHNIREVPKAEWPFIRVADVLIPLEKLRFVEPDTPLWEALQQMTSEGVNQLPVISNGQLVGMISREDLITFIRNRAELGV